jgi:hypothetical protein
MKRLHINPNNKNSNELNKLISDGKHVFVIVYMVGCGPCNSTRPEWEKIEERLDSNSLQNDRLVVADVDQEMMGDIQDLGPISGFPTMRYLHHNGNSLETENYEDSEIPDKSRNVESFIQWINTKQPVHKNSQHTKKHKTKTKSTQQGGKKRRRKKTRTVKKSNKRRRRKHSRTR